MRLSTKGRYAVTALLDLAIHEPKGAVTLADISRNQGISLSYLEQLFAKLRKQGLVKGVRGPGGGYRLTRSGAQVSVADIVVAVDEQWDVTRCKGKENCQDGEPCLTHCLWADLSEQIFNFLHGITLADLINENHVQAVSQRQDARAESRQADTPAV